MRLPSVSDCTDSTAVPPHRWAHSNQPDSSRMPHICCKGEVEEADLDALSDVLRSAVGETLQPTHVSLWLRELELLLMRSYGQEQVAYPNASLIPSAVSRPIEGIQWE